MNLKITTKILISYLTIGILVSLMGVITFTNFSSTIENMGILVNVHVPGNKGVNEITKFALMSINSMRRFLYLKEESDYDKAIAYSQKAEQYINSTIDLAVKIKFEAMVNIMKENLSLLNQKS